VRIAGGDPSLLGDALAVQLKLAGLTAGDAVAAELGLEWIAAGQAALRAGDADLALLTTLVGSAAGALDSLSQFMALSLQFHDTIAAASHNWAIRANLRAIRDIVGRSHTVGHTRDRRERALAAHTKILDAIRGRRPEEAMELMREHVGSTLQGVIRRSSVSEDLASAGGPMAETAGSSAAWDAFSFS